MSWPELRAAWLAATGTAERDVGEGSSDAGEGWTLRAIGRNLGTGLLVSRFAIHESGFAYEERTVGDLLTFHVTSSEPIPDRKWVAEARSKLRGKDTRGRKSKMPAPFAYIVDFRQLRAASGREPTPADMAARYGVTRETESSFRTLYHLPWPPDLYTPHEK